MEDELSVSDFDTCEQEYAEIAPRSGKKSALKTETRQTNLLQESIESETGVEEYTIMAAVKKSDPESKEPPLNTFIVEDKQVQEVTRIATDEEEYVLTTGQRVPDLENCSTEEPIYETGDCITTYTLSKVCEEKAGHESSESLYDLPNEFRKAKRDSAVKKWDNNSDMDVMDDISLALDFRESVRTLAVTRKKIKYQTVLTIVAIAIAGLALLLTFIQFGTVTNEGIPNSWLEFVNSSNLEIVKFQAVQNSQIVKLQAIQIELKQEIATLAGNILNPIVSCGNVTRDSLSGVYWIQNSAGNLVRVYCDTNRTSCSCNTTGGWMRVANVDISDPTQNCPDDFQLTIRSSSPLRTCKRSDRLSGCASALFPTNEIVYSSVCGRVIGYQNGILNGFAPYSMNTTKTINDAYVDGVSLTHGQSPRQHIWTFVADSNLQQTCPCLDPTLSLNSTYTPPPFVNTDYFCESTAAQFNTNDPLWDGRGCGGTSTCCEFNNPPWFCKQLPQPTTHDIELRLCSDTADSKNDILLEIVDIYIQ